jgi:hypothetical protein
MLLRSQIMQRNVLFGLRTQNFKARYPKARTKVWILNSLEPPTYQMYPHGLYLNILRLSTDYNASFCMVLGTDSDYFGTHNINLHGPKKIETVCSPRNTSRTVKYNFVLILAFTANSIVFCGFPLSYIKC